MICPESETGRGLDTWWQHFVQINYAYHPGLGIGIVGTIQGLGGTESGLSSD